jgi:hypothetical protein
MTHPAIKMVQVSIVARQQLMDNDRSMNSPGSDRESYPVPFSQSMTIPMQAASSWPAMLRRRFLLMHRCAGVW